MPRPLHIRRKTIDRDTKIEKACRFIRQAIDRHEKQLGREVGEYLLVDVYRHDLRYVFSKDPTKDRSLRDIAAGTGLQVRTLSRWLKAAAVRRRLRAMGIDVELGLTKLAALHGVGDEETLRRLVEWSGQVGAVEFGKVVRRWTTHLDQGGDPRDLLCEPLPEPEPARRRHARTGRELIVPRLLTLMLEWVRRHPVSPHLRERLLGDMQKLRRSIARAA